MFIINGLTESPTRPLMCQLVCLYFVRAPLFLAAAPPPVYTFVQCTPLHPAIRVPLFHMRLPLLYAHSMLFNFTECCGVLTSPLIGFMYVFPHLDFPPCPTLPNRPIRASECAFSSLAMQGLCSTSTKRILSRFTADLLCVPRCDNPHNAPRLADSYLIRFDLMVSYPPVGLFASL